VAIPVGGRFGGKFVLIEPLVAAAELSGDRCCSNSRTDDFLASNPAPECNQESSLGRQDGTITALGSDMIFDSGSRIRIAAQHRR